MPRQSPAQTQAEAIADVERIAAALQEVSGRLCVERDLVSAVYEWSDVPEDWQAMMRATVVELLHRDVIRVGSRPSCERPMKGQITIEEALDG